ncbi:hypothetical protein HDV00_010458 [Rhizophlyctis rosea]|nr:hypothetical protein HDV00_010458 [Rhizophlyctis rosea]
MFDQSMTDGIDSYGVISTVYHDEGSRAVPSLNLGLHKNVFVKTMYEFSGRNETWNSQRLNDPNLPITPYNPILPPPANPPLVILPEVETNPLRPRAKEDTTFSLKSCYV